MRFGKLCQLVEQPIQGSLHNLGMCLLNILYRDMSVYTVYIVYIQYISIRHIYIYIGENPSKTINQQNHELMMWILEFGISHIGDYGIGMPNNILFIYMLSGSCLEIKLWQLLSSPGRSILLRQPCQAPTPFLFVWHRSLCHIWTQTHSVYLFWVSGASIWKIGEWFKVKKSTDRNGFTGLKEQRLNNKDQMLQTHHDCPWQSILLFL